MMTELDFNNVEEIILRFTDMWKKNIQHVVRELKKEDGGNEATNINTIGDDK